MLELTWRQCDSAANFPPTSLRSNQGKYESAASGEDSVFVISTERRLSVTLGFLSFQDRARLRDGIFTRCSGERLNHY